MKRNSLIMKDYTHHHSCVNNKNPTTTKEFSHVVANCYNNNNIHSNNNIADQNDYVNGFPWPPRSYTCSFCRKEFRSAQALGGHMNVHRRDRARLRQSSPPTHHEVHQGQAQGPMLNLNLNPNSNSSLSLLPPPPSSSATTTTTLKPVFTCTLPLFVSPTPPSPSSELKRWVVVDGIALNPLSKKTSTPEHYSKSKIPESLSSAGVGEYHHDQAFAREDGCKVLKKGGDILRMDLEIGLPRGYDLDLELRLGTTYS
ncbi:hypothetical protein AAZX31_13G251600 [Glycine max]|nr:transcriptional regulator SUPERMAN [Glycine max]XP_028187223.1 transcriptional regulator SUPERMAN-like [Glycine soja]KAG4384408.1 hypothetical protein GLYMA_13G269400v4 [Glycine max]KAG4960725.1 hypothetical protein JHK87_037358 [Glycine soja]KAG4971733.1 hypothetical protein JHK85_038154 [Glycine max]KAG4978124.1 hypothetical protein JHK86_037598 [Glycine max]KAG5114132.1 hypothetical protein JHK82_037401 [Glycine max]|eukprot:XP_003541817.1 transcriptional regulator SUPERMAN [Glycine max]